MKKSILIFVSCILLSGCTNDKVEDKYANFQHYSSSDFEKTLYNNGYVIGVLPSNSMAFEELLLYQVGQDDFIFLTEISGFQEEPNLDKTATYFYKDKLFVLRYVPSVIIEFSLDGEKTKNGKTIYFKYKDKTINVSSIKKVENNYIYLESNEKFKCTLDTHICELDN